MWSASTCLKWRLGVILAVFCAPIDIKIDFNFYKSENLFLRKCFWILEKFWSPLCTDVTKRTVMVDCCDQAFCEYCITTCSSYFHRSVNRPESQLYSFWGPCWTLWGHMLVCFFCPPKKLILTTSARRCFGLTGGGQKSYLAKAK